MFREQFTIYWCITIRVNEYECHECADKTNIIFKAIVFAPCCAASDEGVSEDAMWSAASVDHNKQRAPNSSYASAQRTLRQQLSGAALWWCHAQTLWLWVLLYICYVSVTRHCDHNSNITRIGISHNTESMEISAKCILRPVLNLLTLGNVWSTHLRRLN